ncbi:hypothetical protein [Hymenobacter volaticus]|nr:hypothetical protein [Hymenobacter volaticus]
MLHVRPFRLGPPSTSTRTATLLAVLHHQHAHVQQWHTVDVLLR